MIKIKNAIRLTRAALLWPVRVLLANTFSVCISVCICIFISACGGSSASSTANTSTTNSVANPVSTVIVPIPQAIAREKPVMLHTEGSRWVRTDGSQKILKGVNLGNWLIQEFWMMGQGSNGIDDQCKLEAVLDQRFGYVERERLYRLFRQNWMRSRDWDLIEKFGLNLVRLPFIWSVVEDEKHPGQLRTDAWEYLDDAINQAEQRGMHVILDLHGAVGSQGWEHHSGCAGKNLYWSTPEFQQRTIWLWQQVATRYKDRAAVAGYSLLNEPWGASPDVMAKEVARLYQAVRAVDPNHVIILPGHSSGIDAYGKPADQGMQNVAFEIHPYPGFFGWGEPNLQVHRDWLRCGGLGSTGNTGVCEWNTRLSKLSSALFIGEFQPWAGLGAELGGQITRVTYDTYASYGWAATSWSHKLLSNNGGQGNGTWGLVTNQSGQKIPALNFQTASLAEIEALFNSFGSIPYDPQQAVMAWMTSSVAPDPFARP
ncbi:glycoside hydrolase family 5 protein [Undibacterium flavidum]|uniref:Cellulase family glycosylhydrolase n=1 Tax=Undibacterium flavidum TaxID=2762297 RepID=A0ABR6YAA7_9BURK|nr:cellulase family glycosylhydrolase [Undibacterium flavidum]MBC3873566.1 cellulase family glycosylhydrolase [Undibacterium flavidum]